MHPVQNDIFKLLKKSRDELSINQIAESTNIERHTAGKYLEGLEALGLCQFRAAGKSKLWSVTASPLFSLISKDNPVSAEFKELLEQVEENVTFRDTKHSILWSNKPNQTGKKCYEVFAGQSHACSGCDVEHALSHNENISGTCEHHNITGTPIKDKDGKLVALLNIRKPLEKRN